MSTATAVEGAAPPRGGKKKLIVLLAAVLLLVLAGGGAGLYFLKQRAQQAAQEADDDGAPPQAAARRDPKAVPIYYTLDSFTVNLADREADRYAQISIALELNDAGTGEQVKAFMPAIRNNVLMVLSHKRAADLMERAGKEQLAQEVQRETERALGWEPDARRPAGAQRPIRAVHFSNFIIQ